MLFDALHNLPLFTPIAIGLVMGMLSSLFGIGGGMIAVPLLIFAGVPPVIAVGTQAPAQCLTGVVSVWGHTKKGTVDWMFAGYMIIGGLFALLLGNMLYDYLKQYDVLPWVIKGMYILLMTGIGGMMLVESFLQIIRNQKAETTRGGLIDKVQKWPLLVQFGRANIKVSILLVMLLGVIAGLMSALMGVGGGFFLVPAMMYLMSMDGKIAAGTSLGYIVAIAFVSSFIQIFVHHTVDFVLCALLVVGGTIGARIGLHLLQYVRGPLFRLMFGFFVFGVGITIAVDTFLK